MADSSTDTQPWVEAYPETTGGQDHQAYRIVLTLPTTFEAAFSKPQGPLDCTAAWRTQDLGKLADPCNASYAAYINRTHMYRDVERSSARDRCVRAKARRLWQTYVDEVSAPSALPSGQGSLEESFQLIITSYLDPLLAAPPSGSSNKQEVRLQVPRRTISNCIHPSSLQPDPLHRYKVHGSQRAWMEERELQRSLSYTCVPVANIICQMYAKSKGEAYEVHIVTKEDFRGEFPELQCVKSCGAEFYVISGSPTTRRVSAVVQLLPRASLTFLRYLIKWLQRWISQEEVVYERLDGDETWRDNVTACKVSEEILARLARTGASCLLLWNGWQMVVIDRDMSTEKQVMRLKVHSDVFAQEGPVPSAEPTSAEAEALHAEWNVHTHRSMPAILALLAIRSDLRSHEVSDQSFQPCWKPTSAAAGAVSLASSVSRVSLDAGTLAHTGSFSTFDNDIAGKSIANDAPLAQTHRLLHQHYPYASNYGSSFHHACLIPLDESSCPSLPNFNASNLTPCPHPRHIRAQVKAARTTRLEEGETNIDRREVNEAEDTQDVEEWREALAQREWWLENEVEIVRQLAHLQGSVLPNFYGTWKGEEDNWLHAYEYVGVPFANSYKNHPLQLTDSEKERIAATFESHVANVHRAGFSMSDYARNNLYIRLSPAAPTKLQAVAEAFEASANSGSTAASVQRNFDCRFVSLEGSARLGESRSTRARFCAVDYVQCSATSSKR